MLCDELCIYEDMLVQAVNMFDAFRWTYAPYHPNAACHHHMMLSKAPAVAVVYENPSNCSDR